uniref:Uncharacterized protein n=1 Tax=Rhizophora mucronata TaxID=61149 RepID=A0A2P2J4S7_RHIMU
MNSPSTSRNNKEAAFSTVLHFQGPLLQSIVFDRI